MVSECWDWLFSYATESGGRIWEVLVEARGSPGSRDQAPSREVDASEIYRLGMVCSITGVKGKWTDHSVDGKLGGHQG